MTNSDALFQTKYGWLSPDKQIYPVRFHEHFAFLATRPELYDQFTQFTQTVEANDREMQDDLDSLEPDEHPAMHRFDGMNDEAREILINHIYSIGWIRLGFLMDSQYQYSNISERVNFIRKFASDSTQYTLEAEGFAECLRIRRPMLNNICRELGCQLRVQPIHYEKTKYHRGNHPGFRVRD